MDDKKPTMKLIDVYMPLGMIDGLDAIAEKNNIKRSGVIRAIIDHYLKEEEIFNGG